MVYRAIGLMSGSSLDGLDIVFAEFNVQAGKWAFEIKETSCYPYSKEWKEKLTNATLLSAKDYLLLDADYGHYLGQKVNEFIEEKNLHYQVAVVASHGHTSFHLPAQKMTAQLGDGAAIAAVTGLPVINNLRAMDVALGGQGAPIVPMGEKHLWNDFNFFLNVGGIANLSVAGEPPLGGLGFDVCAANRVLNMLAQDAGKEYDEDGNMAKSGIVDETLLEQLNNEDYYKMPHPKSLANDFGTDIIYPIIKDAGISTANALRTYTEHICLQIKKSLTGLKNTEPRTSNSKLLVTGGGALNTFLINRLTDLLSKENIDVIVPNAILINYKEALIMAFLGVLRWREENTTLTSVTGASRNSIGGALWMGQEA